MPALDRHGCILTRCIAACPTSAAIPGAQRLEPLDFNLPTRFKARGGGVLVHAAPAPAPATVAATPSAASTPVAVTASAPAPSPASGDAAAAAASAPTTGLEAPAVTEAIKLSLDRAPLIGKALKRWSSSSVGMVVALLLLLKMTARECVVPAGMSP
jgi:hypothetical protein